METNVEKFANLDIRVGEILSAEVFAASTARAKESAAMSATP